MPIYLDNNATTKPTKEVVNAMTSALERYWQNPSSTHRGGQEAKHTIEIARGQAARLLGVTSREITFTGSGTEAIGIAILGSLRAAKRSNPSKNIIITSEIEHSAIGNLCKQLEDSGEARVIKLPADRSGMIDVTGLESMIIEHSTGPGHEIAIVSAQWVNNETGMIQPMHRIGEICARHQVVFHSDATQWVGKMPTDLSAPDAPKIDLLNCAPHKFHGPKGVGILWVRKGIRISPVNPGSQELGRRGGTEPVPSILGAGIACDQANEWVQDEHNLSRAQHIRDQLESKILEACPGTVINTPLNPDQRIWSTSSIGFPKLEAEALLLGMSERGVYVSAGSACASGSLDPSPILLAMGVEEHIAHGSIRLSVSRSTSERDIEDAIKVIEQVWAQLSRTIPG